METIEYNGHIICYESFKYKENSSLRDFIINRDYEKVFENIEQKVILVLWWDWSVLTAIRNFSHLKKPFLPLNFWNKWFLLNEISFIDSEEYIVKKYPILEISLKTIDKEFTFYAFNEIDIRAWNWRIITLEIQKNWSKTINISGDWIIFSTPAWSTGYNSSLWWPIIPHDLNAFVITPKAPWKPKWQTPILLSQNEIIKIRNIWRKNSLQIYSDSDPVYSWTWESIELIVKKSQNEIDFLIAKEYVNIWSQKVMLEQWFNF